MLQPKFHLITLVLGLTIPLINHSLPAPSIQKYTKSDVTQNSLEPRDLEYAVNFLRTIRPRNDRINPRSLSENDDASDSALKNSDSRYFMNPAMTPNRPSITDIKVPSDYPEKLSKNRRKRFLDIITGGGDRECGSFGCNNGGTNTREFEYGSDDGPDHNRQRHGNHGYWRKCADDPKYECYYNYDDGARASRGYWADCVDYPKFECYYYNDESFASLGYWDDCVDVENFECYYYYDNWFSNGACRLPAIAQDTYLGPVAI